MYNQSHLAPPSASPSSHGASHEDFDMASPAWSRATASPVNISSHSETPDYMQQNTKYILFINPTIGVQQSSGRTTNATCYQEIRQSVQTIRHGRESRKTWLARQAA